MIGPLEIAIIAVILLLIVGYRFLPQLPGLGRKAGTQAREVKESVQEMVGDKADPKTLGRRAGEGLREAREFRDAVTGKEAPASPEPRAAPAATPEPDPEKSPDPEPR
jgi:Sec-independent protein translocase protein TatA